MTFHGKEVIGKQVVTFDTGEKLTKVYDVLFDQDTNHILGLLVDEGGWFSSARVLRLSDVRKIGEDAVLIDTEQLIISADEDEQIKAVLERNNVLKGTKVMTEDGKDLGTMVDIVFDEMTGKVESYEVSGGLFADAYSGRSLVPAPETLKIGEDIAFVPSHTVQLMEQQVGGIKGVAQNAGEKVKEVSENAADKGQELAHKAADKGQELAHKASEKGQDLAETASEKGQHLKDQAGMKFDQAKAKAKSPETSDALDQVKQTATEAWDTAKQKVTEYKNMATQEVEDRRIKGALGRPASRVVLDSQDQVILDVGEIITNQAVEKARTSNVLDVLLTSVYDKEPELSTDDMKASSMHSQQ